MPFTPPYIVRMIGINLTHILFDRVRERFPRYRRRGGMRWAEGPVAAVADHAIDVYRMIAPHAGDLSGKVALEIGPGDNLGAAYCFLKAGCSKVFTVERHDTVILDEGAAALLRELDARFAASGEARSTLTWRDVLRPRGAGLELNRALLDHRHADLESIHDAKGLDLVYSNDVMEHVDDPALVFRAVSAMLAPRGLFINNVDLGGHNLFDDDTRPLQFLTCEDWLWTLMFSHLVTTNRVRYSELRAGAEAAGLEVEKADVLVRADAEHLREIRPKLLPRYRALSDEDLGVIQCILVARRPPGP